ncbi:dipeptidase [Telmatobacter bradus]|uniref:dipeptidase n=1 Tax=Telmatobacter bradus TaxID=474953 RepID=UPI003B42EA0D
MKRAYSLPSFALIALAATLQSAPLVNAQTAKPSAAHRTADPMPNTASVHASAIVIDTHADTPQRFLDEHFDLSDPLGAGELNLESAKKGNLGAEFFSIWVDPVTYKDHAARRTLELIDAVKLQVARHPDQMLLATSPADIERAHREHKLAALMGIEGGHSIEDSIPLLRQYYALGVRYMTLTWSNSNGWADSSGDFDDKTIPHTPNGLNEFGKDVVYEMNRLGMMIDVSHVSDKTFYRTLVLSQAPLIASHSGARALCDAPRNMTDDMLRAIANGGGPDSKGGVVQVNFYSAFVSQKYRDAKKTMDSEITQAKDALKAKNKAEGRETSQADLENLERTMLDRIPRPPLSDLIDQIDHIAKVAGVDHVGLGSDFDGINGQLPQGINSAADLPKITAELTKRGYSAEDCRKILGGNLLRVFTEVQQIAKTIPSTDRPKLGATK